MKGKAWESNSKISQNFCTRKFEEELMAVTRQKYTDNDWNTKLNWRKFEKMDRSGVSLIEEKKRDETRMI